MYVYVRITLSWYIPRKIHPTGRYRFTPTISRDSGQMGSCGDFVFCEILQDARFSQSLFFDGWQSSCRRDTEFLHVC